MLVEEILLVEILTFLYSSSKLRLGRIFPIEELKRAEAEEIPPPDKWPRRARAPEARPSAYSSGDSIVP